MSELFHKPTTSNNCLVCGSKKSGKKYIIDKLITNAQFKRISNNHSECTWKIINKYYESDIIFSIINSIDLLRANHTDFEDEDININDTQCLNNTTFSAIILVLNLCKSHHLICKDLEEWMHVLSPYLSQSECNLLIGNYIDSYSFGVAKDKEKEYHEYLHNWCIDHVFEFVASPLNESKSNDDEFYGANSSLFASYDGMELSHRRINSALQCVMWPNMMMNPSSKSYNTIQPLLSNVDDRSKECDTFRRGDRVRLVDLKNKKDWNGRTAEIINRFSETNKRWPIEVILDDMKQKALVKTVNLVLIKRMNKVIDEEKVNEENEDQDKEKDNKEFMENMLWNNGEFDNGSLENKMSSFQSLIDEMQNVRKAAKSGQLKDEERRQRAADTAMKLISYMGLDKDNDQQNQEN